MCVCFFFPAKWQPECPRVEQYVVDERYDTILILFDIAPEEYSFSFYRCWILHNGAVIHGFFTDEVVYTVLNITIASNLK